jgi:hypothetical protein
LDELKSIGAIRFLTSSKKMLPKMALAINPRITYKKIRDLEATIDGILLYLSAPSDVAFIEKVSGTKVWSGRAPLLHKRFEPNAIALLRELQTKMVQKKAKRPEGVQKVAHLSVKIVYREARTQLAKHLTSRQNLHRNR